MEPIRINIATFDYLDKKTVFIISALVIIVAIMTALNTSLYLAYKSRIAEFEQKTVRARKLLYAGTWLKDDKWLLIISQEVAEEMSGLLATRNVEIAIIFFGALAIILTTVFTTRSTVNRLRNAEAMIWLGPVTRIF